ncbi:conserved Plasmodium protein, unknown function [Plasmodium gaboni]|uniref:Uncharacterized protein n=2 Tax=Plasmodium gaboni TaxID=647221 RepID=A0ABY1UIZ8_9APIC|nr:conserved Plasmodium protein, unknown function [Plasmodium gaboni]
MALINFKEKIQILLKLKESLIPQIDGNFIGQWEMEALKYQNTSENIMIELKNVNFIETLVSAISSQLSYLRINLQNYAKMNEQEKDKFKRLYVLAALGLIAKLKLILFFSTYVNSRDDTSNSKSFPIINENTYPSQLSHNMENNYDMTISLNMSNNNNINSNNNNITCNNNNNNIDNFINPKESQSVNMYNNNSDEFYVHYQNNTDHFNDAFTNNMTQNNMMNFNAPVNNVTSNNNINNLNINNMNVNNMNVNNMNINNVSTMNNVNNNSKKNNKSNNNNNINCNNSANNFASHFTNNTEDMQLNAINNFVTTQNENIINGPSHTSKKRSLTIAQPQNNNKSINFIKNLQTLNGTKNITNEHMINYNEHVINDESQRFLQQNQYTKYTNNVNQNVSPNNNDNNELTNCSMNFNNYYQHQNNANNTINNNNNINNNSIHDKNIIQSYNNNNMYTFRDDIYKNSYYI